MVARKAGSIAELGKLKLAWIGDGNNVCNSWIEAAGMLGMELAVACPEGFDPDPKFVDFARAAGARLHLLRDPDEAMDGADVVSTDVWASMGQESDAEARRRAFAGYQVNAERWKRTRSGAIFLHCLPAHRGEEVSAEIIDGPMSAIVEQAHNRLHSQKALLELLYA
jgi:ornithine carbamoyltransferase